MSDAEVEALGQAARDWYDANQAGFPARLGHALDTLLR
jgi:hypothetical protein